MEAKEGTKYAEVDGLIAILIAVKDGVSFQETWGRAMAQVQQSSKWLSRLASYLQNHIHTTHIHAHKCKNN